MEIRSASQFLSFIQQYGINNSHVLFTQLENCLNNYQSACDCYKSNDKIDMYKKCNNIYCESIRSVIPSLRLQFLMKTGEHRISFYTEHGALLMTISR